MSQRIGGGQIKAVVAVEFAFQTAEQEGGRQCHREVDHHNDGCRLEVEIKRPDNALVNEEQVCNTDDRQNGSIFDVDDKVMMSFKKYF